LEIRLRIGLGFIVRVVGPRSNATRIGQNLTDVKRFDILTVLLTDLPPDDHRKL